MKYFLYDALTWIFSRIIDIFFREVKARGSHRIPKDGPVVFVCAPHANQFIDPIILIRNSPRRISMLAAKKSCERTFIGKFIMAMQAIPVIRPQDCAKQGTGKIYIKLKEVNLINHPSKPSSSSSQVKEHQEETGKSTRKRLNDEPKFIVYGIHTKFTLELKKRDSIVLPGNLGSAEVLHVISDTELELKSIFPDEAYASSSPLIVNNPTTTAFSSHHDYSNQSNLNTTNNNNRLGSTFKIIPHIYQSEMFKTVVDNLALGKCIGIFPEGGSHDRSEFLPMKAGFAIMALTAMSEHPGLNVKIVPTGLNYFHPDKFRSRAVIEFGEPLIISQELVQGFKSGGEKKRDAVAQLLDHTYKSLKAITVTAPDYDTLMVIQAARRLYRPEHVKLSLNQTLTLTRNFAIGYQQFGNEPKVKELTQRVKEYNRLLQIYGIRDHQVKNVSLGGFRAFQVLLYRTLLLLCLACFIIPGLVLNAPIALIAKSIAHRKAKEAKAASSVKIKGTDVMSTWKIIIASILVPSFYIMYTILFALFMWFIRGIHDAPRVILYSLGLLFIGLPFISYWTMKGTEFGFDILKSLRPLILCLFPGMDTQKLVKVRNALQIFLNQVIEKYGPKAFDDFEKQKVIMNQDKHKGNLLNQLHSSSITSQITLYSPANALVSSDDEFKWSEVDPDEIDDVFIYREQKDGSILAEQDNHHHLHHAFVHVMHPEKAKTASPLRKRDANTHEGTD